MDLFNTNTQSNILPVDGVAIYFGKIFPKDKADYYYDLLLNSIEWRNDEVFILGKRIITSRKVAWYAEKEFTYTYSNATKQSLRFTPELVDLKKLCEQITAGTYNSCLLNLYHNGSEGVSWHSDGEKDLKHEGSIASISLGAERNFQFKHKNTGDKVTVFLEHGSLLEMKGACQINWQHRLPTTTKVTRPRVNLTFRTIEK